MATAAEDLAAALRGGSRRALARAVTLVESTRPDHREEAERLIEAILPATGDATRIGITGPPGAGKSTFIERFGLGGIARRRQIAVLAVDPGSKRGAGAGVAGWQVRVRRVTVLTGNGIGALWGDVARLRAARAARGAWRRRGGEQAQAALGAGIGGGLLDRLRAAPAIAGPRAKAGGE